MHDESAATDGASSVDKHMVFRDLHAEDKIFVLANAWDVGSARMLMALGYQALGTTSAGAAFVAGRLDGAGCISRDVALGHAREIVAATDLPVSADLEDGFGASPENVAETVRAAAAIGLAGCSIEDTTGDPDQPMFSFEDAVARIAAACDVVRGLDRPFMLTARAENFSYGQPNLEDTIARLQAFAACGANVVYAPELPDIETVTSVCAAVDAPVNAVAGLGLPDDVTLGDLQAAGVRRLSLGSSLARVAIGATLRAARALQVDGDLTPLANGAAFAEIEALIEAGTPVATQG